LVCPLAASLDRSLHVCAREFAGTRLVSAAVRAALKTRSWRAKPQPKIIKEDE